MGKFEKKKSAASDRKGKGAFLVCLAAVAVIIAVLVMFFSGEKPEISETTPQAEQEQTLQTQPISGEELPEITQTQPSRLELTLESVEQEEQMMVITTSYCVLKYPFAFSDMVRVTAENQGNQSALQFCAWLSNTEYPIFSIVFDGDEGVPVGTLTLDDGTTVSVTAQIFDADDTIDPDMLQSFYAAQETINDIISSLMDAEGFIPAQ